jgi:hypothetical protein
MRASNWVFLVAGMAIGATAALLVMRPASDASLAGPSGLPKSDTANVQGGGPALPTNPPASWRWSDIESTDYRVYMDNLRRMGCPEPTIRDIVIADICQLYRQEWTRRLMAAHTNYWDPRYGSQTMPPEELRQAALEVRNILADNVRSLLGVDLHRELEKYQDFASHPVDTETLLQVFLPPEKAAAAARSYEKHRLGLESLSGEPFLTQEAVLARKRQWEQLQNELAHVLSPQELQEIQYRLSPVSREIREQFAGFDLTEREFKVLYDRRQQAVDQFVEQVAARSDQERLSADQLLSLSAKAELRESDWREILGPERYAAYQESRDDRFQQLKTVAADNALSIDWLRQVYDYQKNLESSVRQIRENPALTPDAKDQLVRDHYVRHVQQMRQVLGEELTRKLQPVLLGPHGL